MNRYNRTSSAIKYRSRSAVRKRNVKLKQPVTRERVILLLFSSLIMLIFLTAMIYMKSEVYSNKYEILELNKELETIQMNNEADEISVKSNINLNKVYDIATGRFGMKKLTNDKIIKYNNENTDYVKQSAKLTK